MGYIYRIVCKENGKSYIGRTLHDPLKRWKQHVYKSNRNDSKTLLGYAIRKYGASAFEIETLCVVPDHALDNMECYYAEQYESYVWQGGYNQTMCGRGRPYTYETKSETRMKMSKARTGAVVSDETKQKISAAMQGHKRCVGRVVTLESKAKNRASQPCRKLNDADVVYIRENPDKMTQQRLADKFGVSRSLVYLVIYGKAHTPIS
jgi:group I intron endonuclease